jgi:sugar phosphate isomerase/epimerase
MKLGYSCSTHPLTAETFAAYKAAGICAMEISTSKKETADLIDFNQAKALAEQYGIQLWSFHLPFAPFAEIDISVPELAESTVQYFCSLINKAAAVGIKIVVIHPSGEPIAESDRSMRLACAKKSLAVLADYADTKGVTIAVEDLPRTCLGRCSSDILALISAHPSLRVCFDTNHLLNESIHDFIMKTGSKIITTHISDYDTTDERHWLPGEGVIDWHKLHADLVSVGYSGYWLYELSLRGSTPTVDRQRPLTHDDLKRNFDEITAHKPITTVGQGKKGLPMNP